MADASSILERFDRLNIWSRGEERAPNKPLLLLYALGRWSQGDQDDIPYPEVEEKLRKLLKEFGSPRQAVHPEYAFCRMQNDGVWTVHSPPALRTGSAGEPLVSDLKALNVRAGFTNEIKAAFPGVGGFSPSNVWRMRGFYFAYTGDVRQLAKPVRELDGSTPGRVTKEEFVGWARQRLKDTLQLPLGWFSARLIAVNLTQRRVSSWPWKT